jgi:primary-amine oxidase
MEATLTGVLSMGALHRREASEAASCGAGPGRAPSRAWGQTLSRSGIYGPDHQHFFVSRLDLCVDGVANRVVEVETESLPEALARRAGRQPAEGASEGAGAGEARTAWRGGEGWCATDAEEESFAERQGRWNGFLRRSRVLTSEKGAARRALPQRNRGWKVESTTRRNGVGQPTAWALHPGTGSAAAPACDPAAAFLVRASFLHRNLWCTAGTFP